MQKQWDAVDAYLGSTLLPPDAALEAALAASAAAGLPAIAVSPLQGKLLHLLARVQGARNILEIGTLGGYSAIWLARALPPGGRLITLEISPQCASVANASIERAGLSHVVDIRLGVALDSLAILAAEGWGSASGSARAFDLVFIDADKPSNPGYLTWALRLARPGAVIVVDNVVREGAVTDAASADASVQGVRRMLELIAAEPRLSATALQVVGAKGYDGFAIARVNDGPADPEH